MERYATLSSLHQQRNQLPDIPAHIPSDFKNLASLARLFFSPTGMRKKNRLVHETVHFLGLNVQAASHKISPRSDIVSKLQVMLKAVDDTPLTRHQKLLQECAHD